MQGEFWAPRRGTTVQSGFALPWRHIFGRGPQEERITPGTHAHWSLGTEAALKLYFHRSCLELAVAMAPVHQQEGKGRVSGLG